MPLTPSDDALLRRALELALRSVGLSEPNPRVGCVLHDAAGQLAGDGFTQEAGGPHAEVMALRTAAAAGRDIRGGTAWVSLEPCAHHGRTPPCCDALIAAGLRRVVIATEDPFPHVAGQGIARLRAAGVQVDMAEGDVRRAAREINIGFFSRVLRRRPWVRMKVAASLDGRTALANGSSQWITGSQARADGHAWRHRAGAILSASGTVLADDPRLDVRLPGCARQPQRVVLDSRLRTPPTARVLAPPGQVLVLCALEDAARASQLRARGAEVLAMAGGDGRVDIPAMLTLLADRGINELHVEAGATLNGALVAGGHVDEVLAYVAPVLLGAGRGMADGLALGALSQADRMRFVEVQPVGDDLRVRARPLGRDAFLD
ncbi:MAG: bifunctional diaminohydroxyphosphoribosylaminopyrimidine deaminase/5-amino-6-(5-phosphoribosylamino)uracil reductase RibD [Burkholderiales bacterium]|nr:bifunctional diaminohydroxyphosphoribosylaminopyrimidine deaminase/5-amino-6-(5-phosphoribosylamino)uracil reductase RibD [Burkholderiales bacterium]